MGRDEPFICVCALHSDDIEAVIEHRTQFEKAFILLLNYVINPNVHYIQIEYKVLLEGRCEGYIKLHGVVSVLNELPDLVERHKKWKQGKIIKGSYS